MGPPYAEDSDESRGSEERAPTRKQELAVAAIVAVFGTIVVVVAAGLGARVFAAFVAGAGSSAVVACVAVANRLIHDARRPGQAI